MKYHLRLFHTNKTLLVFLYNKWCISEGYLCQNVPWLLHLISDTLLRVKFLFSAVNCFCLIANLTVISYVSLFIIQLCSLLLLFLIRSRILSWKRARRTRRRRARPRTLFFCGVRWKRQGEWDVWLLAPSSSCKYPLGIRMRNTSAILQLLWLKIFLIQYPALLYGYFVHYVTFLVTILVMWSYILRISRCARFVRTPPT